MKPDNVCDVFVRYLVQAELNVFIWRTSHAEIYKPAKWCWCI